MITGIILASGFSRRMETDKLLMDIEGEMLIEKVIKAAIHSNLDDILLVYRVEKIKEIGRKFGVRTVYNGRANLGQSESLKVGIRNAHNMRAFMFLVGDQPFLTSYIIDKLIDEYKESDKPILVPFYNNVRGMPMIISSKYREEILSIVGDKGCRDIVDRNVEHTHKVYIDEDIIGIDIDTKEEYEKLFCIKSTRK